jgi:hypothetical protein
MEYLLEYQSDEYACHGTIGYKILAAFASGARHDARGDAAGCRLLRRPTLAG